MSATVWLNERQCSEMTGIPVGTLQDWRAKKVNLPFSRIGRLVRYAEDEVDAYMRSQQVEVARAS